jgi:L-rhamnose isomerase
VAVVMVKVPSWSVGTVGTHIVGLL